MKYIYFFSFSHDEGQTVRFSNGKLTCEKEIDGLAEIFKAEREFGRLGGFKNVVILNVQLLRKDEK